MRKQISIRCQRVECSPAGHFGLQPAKDARASARLRAFAAPRLRPARLPRSRKTGHNNPHTRICVFHPYMRFFEPRSPQPPLAEGCSSRIRSKRSLRWLRTVIPGKYVLARPPRWQRERAQATLNKSRPIRPCQPQPPAATARNALSLVQPFAGCDPNSYRKRWP